MEKGILKEMEKIVPQVMRMSVVKVSGQMWIDYDKGADVLYISFEKPQHADDSIMERDTIIHMRKKKVVGFTILHASKFGS